MSDLACAFAATHYRVRLARGGYSTIRIGQPLPDSLLDMLPHADAPWAFVTAWNPLSLPQPRGINRTRQHQLLTALRQTQPQLILRAGAGVGADRQWRESSLFVIGMPLATLKRVMQPFEQHAFVHGAGAQPARLLWMHPFHGP